MLKYLISSYTDVLDKEAGGLNKARIKLLGILLIVFILQRTVAIWLLVGEAESVFIWRSALLLGSLTLALWLLLAGFSWKAIGHFYIISVSILIWSSIIALGQEVNIVIVQYMLIIISVAYYILGTRWGLVYSILNILPMAILVLIGGDTEIMLSYDSQVLNVAAFRFFFIYNFASLLFVHYFFFSAFKKSNERELQLSLNLQKSLKDAQDIAQAKTNFLSTMSHELRTPLNAVILMAELLSNDELQPGQKYNLEVLRSSAQSLMFVINDILDFNKIEASKVVLQRNPFKPAILLRNIHNSFLPESTSKMIALNLSFDPGLDELELLGDNERLSQILYNLVGNAVKFTHMGSVGIEALVTGREPDKITVLFSVQDTGIGISAEQQEAIFEPYIQKSSKLGRQYHGTGLGLTIASRLVMLQGGSLALESSEGVGTKLSFELTFELVLFPEIDRKLPDPADISELRILVAEDNAINVLVLRKLLNKWGIEPVIAENGREAVAAVEAGHFDVVLMDINMPLMDGFEASEMIRNMGDKIKASVPIIALTAAFDATIEQHPGYQLLSDHMLKPFQPALLREKLKKLKYSR